MTRRVLAVVALVALLVGGYFVVSVLVPIGDESGRAPTPVTVSMTLTANPPRATISTPVAQSRRVFAVKKGMSEAQVIAIAGEPDFRGGAIGRNCWYYAASKAGTSLVGKIFCFKGGRVTRVRIAVHG